VVFLEYRRLETVKPETAAAMPPVCPEAKADEKPDEAFLMLWAASFEGALAHDCDIR
jgi:hypothetical protein